MQTKEAVLSRRSVRKYQTKDVPKEIIEDLVLAGRSAPTGLNRQEVKFYIIANDVKKIQSIGAKALGFNADYMIFLGSSTCDDEEEILLKALKKCKNIDKRLKLLIGMLKDILRLFTFENIEA